jgi:hypothetical protein
VHVILSSNVFVAPLRALAVALAASSRVSVKPSTRDSVLARALVERAGSLGIARRDSRDVSAILEGEIHVYGRDETISAVRRAASSGVRVYGHGAGMGVAVVTERCEVDEAAARVTDDVVVFDQRGCLSPRVVVAIGDAARGERFGAELHRALADRERTVPRGRLGESELREVARYAETMTFAGTLWRGEAHMVGVGTDLLVPPPGRHVHVLVVPTVEQARRLLAPLARYVVAIGSDDPGIVARAVGDAVRVRGSALGFMQRPPLDGPVDLR